MAIRTETYTKDRQISKHFALHEFKCKDSNTIKYSEETVDLLEKIFSLCNKISKAIITSGYRTPEYSVKVGGTKNDGHTVGIAVDVKWYDKQNRIIPPKYIACVAQDIGFTGIGLMSNSIHLDTRTKGNYKNGKWWGDETNGKNNITDFYSYTGLTREEVDEFLCRASKIEQTPVQAETKSYMLGTSLEDLESSNFKILQNAIARAQATGKNVYDNNSNMVWEYVDVQKTEIKKEEAETNTEDFVKENANVIVRFFSFIVNLIKKILGE